MTTRLFVKTMIGWHLEIMRIYQKFFMMLLILWIQIGRKERPF